MLLIEWCVTTLAILEVILSVFICLTHKLYSGAIWIAFALVYKIMTIFYSIIDQIPYLDIFCIIQS